MKTMLDLKRALDSLSMKYSDARYEAIHDEDEQLVDKIDLKKQLIAELRWELFGYD